MKGNSNYEADVKYAVYVTRGVLNLIGTWPSSRDASAMRNLPRRLLNTICQLLLYFILIPGLLKMFLREPNMRARLKMVGPMCYCLMAVIKYTIFLLRGREIRECLKCIEFDWKTIDQSNDRRTMMEYARIGRSLAIVSVLFVYGSGFSYRTIVPLTKGTVVTDQNVTIRTLPFAGFYVFFDPRITPTYEIVFTVQFVAGFVQYSVTSGAVSLAALFVLHACGQLKILMSRLNDLTEGNDHPGNANKALAVIIEHHIRIKSFLGLVENVLQHMCLVEVIGCTLILCLLGYYIILEWQDSDSVALLTYTILLITFTFNIFIFCFIGELLNDQGIKVHATSCTLKWYCIPDKTARCLILLIAMSSSPIKITAGKFMDLSMNSFGAIVRTSVAYLNMLRATSI